jgi:hypothetical protein
MHMDSPGWLAAFLHVQVNSSAVYVTTFSSSQLSINNTYLTCDSGTEVPGAEAVISTPSDLAQALATAAALANSSAPVMTADLQLLNSVTARPSDPVQFPTTSVQVLTLYAQVRSAPPPARLWTSKAASWYLQ